jgi:hypothetical protein
MLITNEVVLTNFYFQSMNGGFAGGKPTYWSNFIAQEGQVTVDFKMH